MAYYGNPIAFDDYKEKLMFRAEWYEADACMYKHFNMNFYPSDSCIELYDADAAKIYLKRSRVEGVAFKDMFIGNTIKVFGRLIKIVDYGDGRTKKRLSVLQQKTFAMIKPGTTARICDILMEIVKQGFRILRLKMCQMTRDEAMTFYEKRKTESIIPFLIAKICQGTVVAMEIVGDKAIERWREVMGPANPDEAKEKAPTSLRAQYGVETSNNGFHGSSDEDDVLRETEFFFPVNRKLRTPPALTPTFRNCTLCIIKPHIFDDGLLGNVIQAIEEAGFVITAMASVQLTTINAEEFFEIYRGVIDDFSGMISHIASGSSLAMEITSPNADTFCEFRKFCGPWDPNIARQIRPASLRARFGINRNCNAVHCTDLIDDAMSDVEYFFKILDL